MKRLILLLFLFNIIINFATLINANEPTSLQVIVGGSLLLSCPTDKERPEWWQLNNYAIVEATADGPINGKPNVAIDGKLLNITNISFQDDGTYSCSDTASPMASFKVEVHAPPLPVVIWALPQNAEQKQVVICESRYGRPVASIEWEVNGKTAEPKSGEIRHEANNTFTISSTIEVAVSNDVVSVMCRAKQLHYENGVSVSEMKTLRTYSLSQPTVSPGKLDKLRAGQTIMVECRIPDTNPRPSLIWTLPNGVERGQVGIETGFIVNRLMLTVTRDMHTKSLLCRSELSSYERSVSVEFKMDVTYAPSKPTMAIILPSGEAAIGLADLLKVKFNCDGVDANPKAQARLIINGVEVDMSLMNPPPMTNSLLNLIPNGNLTKQISDSVRSFGKRTTVGCIATNPIGSNASDFVALPVYAAPSIVRLDPIAGEFQRNLADGVYSYRSGATANFYCDMTGGEMTQNAKVLWSVRCPSGVENGDVEIFNTTTAVDFDGGDLQHVRSTWSRVMTKIDNGCKITCQAIDPVAGNSATNVQPVKLRIFYGPDEVSVHFAQAAAYKDGEKVEATCEVGASHPKPRISWSILTPNKQDTATSVPDGKPDINCTSGPVSFCNATIEFVARADINGSIIRCTATNTNTNTVVANDRRIDVLFKPRTTNPSRCFSRFVVHFEKAHNLTEHCAFQANPPIISQLTQIWLVSSANSTIRQRLSPPNGYPAAQPDARPPWEMVQFPRRFNTIEDLNYLDSYLIVTLQNPIDTAEFQVPVRISHNAIDLHYFNPSTRLEEIWIGDSVEISCTISSLYKFSRFYFDPNWIRQGDVVQATQADSRTIKMIVPKVQQDVHLPGEVRRVRCIAEFPRDTVKTITESRDIPIFSPIKVVQIIENGGEVCCMPKVGGGGKLQYRWRENGVAMNNGALTDNNAVPANIPTRYQCEITQTLGGKELAVVESDIYVVGQTPVDAIFFNLNITALRVFSSSAEFFVEKRPIDSVVLSPSTILPPAELRVSIQRDGNEQEYRLTVSVAGDWQIFNITDLIPGSAYNFTFWTKVPPLQTSQPNPLPENWMMFSTVVISTTGAPVAVLRLRPEETAIIVILSAVTAVLFLLLCNIFVCIKLRRNRQLMEAARQAVGRRPSSCCFIGDSISKQDHETTATSDTSPPASEAESGPTSIDMLTPNGASCSSSTSNGSANALYVANPDNNITSTMKTGRKSTTSSSRRKSTDHLVEVVQGIFRPDGLLLKSKHAQPVNVPEQQPLSNSIYRELFGNDTNLSPILPNLDFLDVPISQLQQPELLENNSLYRSQSSAVYNIPLPFQFQHVGGDVVSATATALPVSIIPSTETARSESSEVPLELQGDLV